MESLPLASRLQGKQVGRWSVVMKREKADGDNSGFWSTCYTVVNEKGEYAFMKAYNYSYAFRGTASSADVLRYMTENFTYERDLLSFCAERNMDRVVVAIDSGEYREAAEILPVPYLVFEIAQGNLKTHEGLMNPDLVWKLRAFHGALVGLSQLHKAKIAHQDIKPSNILIFGQAYSRISDLGSATQLENPSNWLTDGPCGDRRYAPIELLYGYFSPDWYTRRIAADLFMMGGILVFMITGTNFLALIHQRIPDSHKFDRFGGTFEQVRPFVVKAYVEALEEIRPLIPETVREGLLDVIAQLCHPIPEERGQKPSVDDRRIQYSLERLISKVDLLARKLAIRKHA